MINHEHYAYKVIWSVEDNEYVGLCAEFPSLSFLHSKQTKALEGVINLVKSVVEEMQLSKETPPTPISERNYSGKFQVRITPEQHRMLAIKALEEGISLNRYISYKLAS